MIFTGFKRKTNQIFFNKQLSNLLKNRNVNSSDKVKKVLVFVDDISKKEEILIDLKQQLEIPEIEIDILIFQNKRDKKNTNEAVFTPSDFGWYGKINSEKLTNILTKKYDLLINYSKVENIYSNLLILQCKTAFNVGFSDLDERFYDLLITCDKSDVGVFNKELKKYLDILNKI